MITKKCSKCGKIKDINEFYINNYNKSGHRSFCKKCKYEQTEIYRKNNPEKVKEMKRKWRLDNPEKVKEMKRKWSRNNPEKDNERKIRWAKNNPKKIIKASKKWNKNNPNYGKEWYRNKRETDPVFRLGKNLSRQIRESIHKNKNGYHWEDLIGYTLKDLKTYLKSLFKKNMTWDNYGKWHIDHIIPQSLWKFDSYEDREFKQCWALCNLQPLWAYENLSKGGKVR